MPPSGRNVTRLTGSGSWSGRVSKRAVRASVASRAILLPVNPQVRTGHGAPRFGCVPETALSDGNNVRELQKLLNQLVGTGKKRSRDSDAQRLRGFHVDHQLRFGRLLDWQFGGLCSLQDLVDVSGKALVAVDKTRAVGHQTSFVRVLTKAVHVWEAVLSGESDNQ
jgi:hypothetical protein